MYRHAPGHPVHRPPHRRPSRSSARRFLRLAGYSLALLALLGGTAAWQGDGVAAAPKPPSSTSTSHPETTTTSPVSNSLALKYSYANGSAQISWSPPASSSKNPITGYIVGVIPTYTDRLPDPQARSVIETVGPDVRKASITGLLEDCHQRYSITVTPQTATGTEDPAATPSFRPSGIVSKGDPPYVVVLLDGINEAQPGFTFDPYNPTEDGQPS